MHSGMFGLGSRIETPGRLTGLAQKLKRIPHAGGPTSTGNAQAARLQLNTLLSASTAPATRLQLLELITSVPQIAENWQCLDPAEVRQKFADLGRQEPSLSAKLGQILNHLGFQQRQLPTMTLPTMADIANPACRLDVLLKVRATGEIANPGIMGAPAIKAEVKAILLLRYDNGTLTSATIVGLMNDTDAEVAEGARKTAADLLGKLADEVVLQKREAEKVHTLEAQLRTAQADAGKVAGLDAEIARLTTELAEAIAAADEIPDFQTAVDSLSEHVREAEDRLAEARAEADSAAVLRTENAELRARALAAAEALDRAPKDAPAAIEALVASLIEQFRTVTEEIDNLTRQLEGQTGERAPLAREKPAIDRAHSKATARKDELDGRINARREEYDGSYANESSHLDALRTQLGVFEIDKQHLPLYCLTKKEKARIAELEEAIGNLTDRNRDRQPKLEAKIAGIKEKARTREMEKLRAEVAISQGLIAEIDAQYTAAVHKFRAEEREFKRLNEQTIPPLAARLGELNTALGELDAEIGRLTGELDGKNGEKADITRQISDLAAAERSRGDRLLEILNPEPRKG